MAVDGNVYFSSDWVAGAYSGRATPAGVITATALVGRGLAAGPDGNLWSVFDADGVHRLTLTGTDTRFITGITSQIPGGSPDHIINGPDGNLWFMESGLNSLDRITPNRLITPIAQGSGYFEVTVGPDGALWSVDQDRGIGRMNSNGVFINFPFPNGMYGYGLLVSGSDGNLWFVANEQIAGTSTYRNTLVRVSTSGVFTTFPEAFPTDARLLGIALGPDGNLWFTDCQRDRIGRITPSGVVTEFSVGITAGSCPRNIVTGPDGNLWFTEGSNAIGRITPTGVVTEFGRKALYSSDLTAITAGPDGNLWFTEGSGNRVGRITPAGVITEFKLTGLADNAGLSSITTGPDKKLWFTEKNANKIGNFTPP